MAEIKLAKKVERSIKDHEQYWNQYVATDKQIIESICESKGLSYDCTMNIRYGGQRITLN